MLVEAEPEIFRPVPGEWGKQGHTNVLLAKADDNAEKRADDRVGECRAENGGKIRQESIALISHCIKFTAVTSLII